MSAKDTRKGDPQPTLRADLAAALSPIEVPPDAAAPQAPVLVPWQARLERAWVACTVARDAPARPAHGRWGRRVLWALSDPAWNAVAGQAGSAGVPWPHLRQICRIERRRIDARTGESVLEVGYAVTSLTPQQADDTQPSAGNPRLADLVRAEWHIENRLHWVRDVTFDEDRCQMCSGAVPQTLACCRNLIIALPRQAGHEKSAAGLRTHAASRCGRGARLSHHPS